MGYVVTAAYVTLRAKNTVGQDVVQGFYEGAVLPDGVNDDDLQRHLRKGMVAEEGTPEADAATPFGKPVEFDDLGMPLSEQARREKAARASAHKPADTRRRQADARPDARPEAKADGRADGKTGS